MPAMRLTPAYLFSLALLACGGGEVPDTPSDGPPGNGDGGGVIDAAPDTPDAMTGPQPVRFVVMGDVGEGNADQALVADAILDKCNQDGCDFVMLLGDNIYDSGVDGVNDPQWQSKFETPYQNLDLPFYVVLGNHDYGGDLFGLDQGGLGNEWDKGPVEVQYSDVSEKWTMPATHYTFTWGNVGFIMLDTNSILWDNNKHGDQAAWYPTALMEVSDADWVFAAGHHPVRSNGAHGNAGNYESIEVGGVEIPNPLPILNGGNVEDFFDQVVCGTVDAYFAGHDHNRQWLDEPGELCGAELIVSGAGAKTKDLEDRGNAFHWQTADVEGFFYVTIVGDNFRGQFIDKNGNLEFEREFIRTP